MLLVIASFSNDENEVLIEILFDFGYMDSSLNISFFLKFDLFDVSSVDSFISFFFFVEEIDSLLSGLEFFFLSSRSDGNDLDYFLY